jgi:hypothetical protein
MRFFENEIFKISEIKILIQKIGKIKPQTSRKSHLRVPRHNYFMKIDLDSLLYEVRGTTGTTVRGS